MVDYSTKKAGIFRYRVFTW